MGAVTELAKRGGVATGSHHAHGAALLGQWAVGGAATVAPGAVAALSTGTASVMAGVGAAAAAAAPVLVVAAAGFAAYKLVEWICD